MTALLEYEPERKALVIRHMALSGDLLLMRTDQEEACLRLPLARKP